MKNDGVRLKETEEKPEEECGVFGAYDFDGADVASTIYYGLYALQHRGQESCGIAVSDTAGRGPCAVLHRRKFHKRKCPAAGIKLREGNPWACAQRESHQRTGA